MSGRLLAGVMRGPEAASTLGPREWTALIAAARAEQMIGNLADRLRGVPVPDHVAAILADAADEARQGQVRALWEADRAAEALVPLGVAVVLLKGTAFAAAGLTAGRGRSIGDLDILVPRATLEEVEAALFGAGWEWVKDDSYDLSYYRRWMHELPPMIHRERDRMIDVHHTILPPTARPTPDAAALLADAVPAEGGKFLTLSPDDMICHAAAHLLADGDLAGGMRNIWDIHCLVDQFYNSVEDFRRLEARARRHQLLPFVRRAMRLAGALYGTVDPAGLGGRARLSDRLYLARLTARDGWGRERRKALRFLFFVRSHAIRMPPAMLARHLWTKWRKGHRPI